MKNRTYMHRQSICPGCNEPRNVTSDPKDRGMPRPGDLTLCINCGTILVFDRKLRLCAVTKEHLERLAATCPQTMDDLKEQQDRWRAYHGKNPVVSLPPRQPH